MTPKSDDDQFLERIIYICKDRLAYGDNHRAAFGATVAFISTKYLDMESYRVYLSIKIALNYNADDINSDSDSLRLGFLMVLGLFVS